MTKTETCSNIYVMTLSGKLRPGIFLPWIAQRAARLGLKHEVQQADENVIRLHVGGPEELVDMMEVSCLLGPFDVWVDAIDRTPAAMTSLVARI